MRATKLFVDVFGIRIESPIVAIDINLRKICLRGMHIIAEDVIGHHLADHRGVCIAVSQLDRRKALVGLVCCPCT